MAKVIFSSTNTLTQHVNKLNDLSLDVGDLASLNTTVDSDIVGAINELRADVDSNTTNLNADIIQLRIDVDSIGTNLDDNVKDAFKGFLVSNSNSNAGTVDFTNDADFLFSSGDAAHDSFNLVLSEYRPNITFNDRSTTSHSTDFQIWIDSGALTFQSGSVDSASVSHKFTDQNNGLSIMTLDYRNGGSVTITNDLVGGNLTSSNYASTTTLIIYDSSGSAVKTLYSPAT